MNTIDLFCGCGGMSLGFTNAGFNILAAFDNWNTAIDIYQANFAHAIYNIDLSDLNCIEKISPYKPEMIIGGPPCQDFSSAGKRDESLGRADLTISFAHIITKVKPQWFVMENVARIEKSDILKRVEAIFQEAGYGLTKQILNASLCGVPQRRKRFFMIGRLNGKNEELTYYLTKNQAKKEMTLFDFFGDNLGVEHYYRHPRSYQRRGIFSIYEPSPTVRGVNRPMPKTYKQHSGDKCPPSENIRALTTLERSYIQTFPRDFKFYGTKSNLEQMIGNAVPVKLAEYIANCIQEFTKDKTNLSEAKQIDKLGQLRLVMD